MNLPRALKRLNAEEKTVTTNGSNHPRKASESLLCHRPHLEALR